MKLRPETVAVSLGRGEAVPGGPVNVPPVLSSTFHADGELIYGRDGNPTWTAFEEVVGALEGGTAVAFASGLAAIAAVVESFPAGALVVAPADGYYNMRRFLTDLESRGRLRVRFVDMGDVSGLAAACDGAGLVWVETPSNPLMTEVDIGAVRAATAAVVAVDNTFATPLRQRPLELGADLVVHSATKFLAGHTDVVMGVAVAVDPMWVERLRTRRSLHGAIPGPLETFLALRGLRTLAVRLDRSEASARELAARLDGHPAVALVRYPGWGAVLSFEVEGGAAEADAVCAATTIMTNATSLGGVESLLERRNRWSGEASTPPSLIRLSVGIEHVEDLWADLDQALSKATAS
jgi:cystathionine gamma-synthase